MTEIPDEKPPVIWILDNIDKDVQVVSTGDAAYDMILPWANIFFPMGAETQEETQEILDKIKNKKGGRIIKR